MKAFKAYLKTNECIELSQKIKEISWPLKASHLLRRMELWGTNHERKLSFVSDYSIFMDSYLASKRKIAEESKKKPKETVVVLDNEDEEPVAISEDSKTNALENKTIQIIKNVNKFKRIQ